MFKVRQRIIYSNSIIKTIINFIFNYPTTVNLNFLWNFGSLSGLCLVLQIITGIFLAMHYVSGSEIAFNSVEHIMRDVNFGWLLRYLHSNGASFFFLVVYIHVLRGIFFFSFLSPRHLLWISGVLILLTMILTAFLGYVLPWGQMSFWAATVITKLASAIPFIGETIVTWLWGGYAVDNATLNRFFSFHFFFPFIITALVILHLIFLHEYSSTNPIGTSSIDDKSGFNPYYIIKDFLGLCVFLFFFDFFVFFFPNFLGHTDNYIMANPLVTPTHIVPEWYFLPFYAILRSIPDKLLGVGALLSSILSLMIIPFLFFPEKFGKSFTQNTYFRVFFWFVAFNCLILGWIGGKSIENPFYEIGQISTTFYFFVFSVYFFFDFLLSKSISFLKTQVENLIDNLSKSKYSLNADPFTVFCAVYATVILLYEFACAYHDLTMDVVYIASCKRCGKPLDDIFEIGRECDCFFRDDYD